MLFGRKSLCLTLLSYGSIRSPSLSLSLSTTTLPRARIKPLTPPLPLGGLSPPETPMIEDYGASFQPSHGTHTPFFFVFFVCFMVHIQLTCISAFILRASRERSA